MFFNEEQLNHIAHLITDPLQKEGLLTFKDPTRALRLVKEELRGFFKVYEDIDEAVKKKISSQKKGILEGSREWEVLYSKYFNEETNKRRV